MPRLFSTHARITRPTTLSVSWLNKTTKDAIDELAEVLEYGREKGIDMGGVIFGTGATAAQQYVFSSSRAF